MPTPRRDFTNRTKEIEELSNTLNSESPEKDSLVLLHGRAGIGKTQLLAKFLRDCNRLGIATAYVDLNGLDYHGLIDNIVEDLGGREFEPLDQAYQDILVRSQNSRIQATAASLQTSAGEASPTGGSGITFNAPLNAETQMFVTGGVHYHNPIINQVINIETNEPIQARELNQKKITHIFKDCLTVLASQRLVAILLDNWENANDPLRLWLNEHLFNWAAEYYLKKALVILARTDVPIDYENKAGILPLPVPPFSREAALEFWERNGLSRDQFNSLAEEIYSTPLLIAMEIDKQRLKARQ